MALFSHATQEPPEPADTATARHIAVIMDGNGRWAQQQNVPRKIGHQRGAEALKKLVEHAAEYRVEYLTVYAFSSENWNRPHDEVSDLMDLMRYYLRHEIKALHKNQIRLRFIGNRTQLSNDIQQELRDAEALTAGNTRLTLVIALSYGSRQELIRTMQHIATEVAGGKLKPEEIDEYTVLAHLDTAALPDPDLLIRTGGEQRLSNFLLWQSAYTELYFTDTLWPDFSKRDLEAAIDAYGLRERRFGGRLS